MREAFPAVSLSPQRFVLDRERYTAVGGTAGLELMLQLIGRSHGPALVDAISETLVLEQVRSEPGPPQMSFRQALGSAQPKLQEAIALMETLKIYFAEIAIIMMSISWIQMEALAITFLVAREMTE